MKVGPLAAIAPSAQAAGLLQAATGEGERNEDGWYP